MSLLAGLSQQGEALTAHNDDAAAHGGKPIARGLIAFLGDSITAGGETYSATWNTFPVEHSNSIGLYCTLASDGGLTFMQNAGVSGQTSSQIAARVGEVVASGANICVIVSATWNDISASVELATSIANYRSMIASLVEANILPVLCSPTPDAELFEDATRATASMGRRRALAELASELSIPYIDIGSRLIDAKTGCLRSDYRNDGYDIHPNSAGRKAAGDYLAEQLEKLVCHRAAHSYSLRDTSDLASGYGFFTVDTNADGVSDGWSGGASGSGFTWSRTSSVERGWIQKGEASSNAGWAWLTRNVTVIAGHEYELSVSITKSGAVDAQVMVYTPAGYFRIAVNAGDADVDAKRVTARFVAPQSGSTDIYIGCGAGTGTVEYAGLTLVDLGEKQ